ncbi:hypothetical protein CYMTET_41404 [Cymbomonas tetramitiformis]|uniref:Uncharacterized protein n=1 Tax=Cymbomonas tetramitiformis TaxID=36881 RepID=A0AAE0F207_9CHLO|nr:hypothetical protein CYMTET_41404 [Cymbomonas tetramitiformis]
MITHSQNARDIPTTNTGAIGGTESPTEVDRRRRITLRDAALNDATIYTINRSAGDPYDLLEMRFELDEDNNPILDGTYFETWPNSAEFKNLKGRFCAVDGGYIARVVRCEARTKTLMLDFGCFLMYEHEADYKIPVTDYSNEATHVRLFKSDFVDVWKRLHPSRRGAMEWITHTADNGFLGARCSRYNAIRHLHFRYLSSGRANSLPVYLRDFTKNMQWCVAFSMLESLHLNRARHGLSTASGLKPSENAEDGLDIWSRWRQHPLYSSATWGQIGSLPATSASLRSVVKRMRSALEIARDTFMPEIEGVLVSDARRNAASTGGAERERASMDHAGCFPATCTFGWSAVRVGRSPTKQLKASRANPTTRYYFSLRSDTSDKRKSTATRDLQDRLLVYEVRVHPMRPHAYAADQDAAASARTYDPDNFEIMLESLPERRAKNG